MSPESCSPYRNLVFYLYFEQLNSSKTTNQLNVLGQFPPYIGALCVYSSLLHLSIVVLYQTKPKSRPNFTTYNLLTVRNNVVKVNIMYRPPQFVFDTKHTKCQTHIYVQLSHHTHTLHSSGIPNIISGVPQLTHSFTRTELKCERAITEARLAPPKRICISQPSWLTAS